MISSCATFGQEQYSIRCQHLMLEAPWELQVEARQLEISARSESPWVQLVHRLVERACLEKLVWARPAR